MAEDGSEDHRGVVVQSPVPDAIVQLKQSLQLAVERFHRHLTACVQLLTGRRLKVLASGFPSLAMILMRTTLARVGLSRPTGPGTRHFGAEEATLWWPAVVRLLHQFGQGGRPPIAIIKRGSPGKPGLGNHWQKST